MTRPRAASNKLKLIAAGVWLKFIFIINVSRKRVQAPRKQSSKRLKTSSSKKLSRWRPAVVNKIDPYIAPQNGQNNETTVELHYCTKFSVNPGALGLASTQQFRLTSIFDPDLTGVGGQPLGRDQYAALFEKYCVFEATYKVCCKGTSANDVIVAVGVSDVDTTSTAIEEYIEQGQYDWKVLTVTGGDADAIYFYGTYDIAQAHGVTRKELLADDLYRATMGTNPLENINLNIAMADWTNGDPAAVNCFVEIRYKCRLTGGILVSRS